MNRHSQKNANHNDFNTVDPVQHLYPANDRNHCPNCAGLHWYIGRVTAECANCGTPLSLSSVSGGIGHSGFSVTRSSTIRN